MTYKFENVTEEGRKWVAKAILHPEFTTETYMLELSKKVFVAYDGDGDFRIQKVVKETRDSFITEDLASGSFFED